MKLIAKGNANWDYYFDESINAILYIPKEGERVNGGVFCGAKNFSAHLRRLEYITGSKIDWEIIDNEFFKEM